MTTIKDIAQQAGVSIATVSRALNNGPKVSENMRKKIANIALQLGYTPNANARALVKKVNPSIGVIVPDIKDPFFASLAHSIDLVAGKNDMQLLLSTGKQSAVEEERAIELLQQQQCNSIVAHTKKLSDTKLIELCKKIPHLILIDRYIEGFEHRCVWLDNFTGGQIAARFLIANGHQKIAYIDSTLDIEDPKLRLSGFIDVLSKHDIQLNSCLTTKAEPSLHGGEIAARKLLAQEQDFTALFAYNDAMAIGAISVFEDHGYRVPADISVLGFDDVLISQYSRPKLSTLRYPIEQMAEHAAKLAISESTDKPVSKYIPELVQRHSVLRIN